jgi:hypothetical protein
VFKNDKFFNECVKRWNIFETFLFALHFSDQCAQKMFYILKTESRVKCINDSFFKPKLVILLINHELDWHKIFNHLKYFDISHLFGKNLICSKLHTATFRMSVEECSMYMYGSALSTELSSSKLKFRFFKSKMN